MGTKDLPEKEAESSGPEETYSIVRYRALSLSHDYLGYIYSKWLWSHWARNDFFRLSNLKSYRKAYKAHIAKVLHQENCQVKLATLTLTPDVCLGFSVFRDHVLDYVYVEKTFRRQGLGTRLLPEGITTFTHLTRPALTIWGSKYGKWIFDPFI